MKHPALSFLVVMLILASASGLVQAQVATSSLLSGGQAVTDNPAAMQWSRSSFASAVNGRGVFSNKDALGNEIEVGEFRQPGYNFRHLGESFGLAFGQSRGEGEMDMVNLPTESFSMTASEGVIGLSLKMKDFLAIGGSLRRTEAQWEADIPFYEVDGGGNITDGRIFLTSNETSELQTGGASFRLAEVFFIGAAIGSEKGVFEKGHTFKGTVNGTPQEEGWQGDYEDIRKINLIGIGFSALDKDGDGIRLEISRIEGDPFENRETGEEEDEFSRAMVSGEVVWANILLGFVRENSTSKNLEIDNGLQIIKQTDLAKSVMTMGWSPLEGFTLAGAVQTSEFKELIDGKKDKTKIEAVTYMMIGWNY